MPKTFSVDELVDRVKQTFARVSDVRTRPNRVYEMEDAVMSAFSVFFMQSPSFLAHQRDMQRMKGCDNVTSLFAAEQIPSDPQIRNLLDPVPPAEVYELFWWSLAQLRQTRHWARFRGIEQNLLVALDGTQYFSSYKIHCAQCSRRQTRQGTLYTHSVLTPVLVGLDHSHVLPLPPEFIRPQDGAEKQDCERNAAARWVREQAAHLAPDAVTILADDLHCHQPFCQQLVAAGLNFILVCKPASHVTLYEEVALLEQGGHLQQQTQRHWNGRHHETWRYRYIEHVPLRNSADTVYVNWCEITVTDSASSKPLYCNTFVTNHPITAETVALLVRSGRARWKVENENNNVLKRYGYHLEHNFGHGDQYLAMFLLTLNLLAFLCHTLLHLTNHKVQRLRQELGTRRTFFQDLRTLTRYLCFQDWSHLLNFMIQGLDLDPVPD